MKWKWHNTVDTSHLITIAFTMLFLCLLRIFPRICECSTWLQICNTFKLCVVEKYGKKIAHKLRKNLKADANVQRHPLIWKMECSPEKGRTLGIHRLNRSKGRIRRHSWATNGVGWAGCVQRSNAFTLLLLSFLKHLSWASALTHWTSNDTAAPRSLWTLNT